MDSLVVCIEPITFDKARLTRYLGQLESDELAQVQIIIRRSLAL